jgi:hypothetical protein
MPQSAASNSIKWEVIDVSDLSNIEQFEKRNFTFTVRISDPEVLGKLKESGFHIGGGASLTPNDQTKFFGNGKNAFLSYPCFSVKPPAFGADNAYSALRGTETRNSTYSDFKYNCWFPAGMRQGKYTLTIYQNLALNGGWSSSDSWANFQMFVFGQSDSPLSKYYSQVFQSLLKGSMVVQGKLPITEISVFRNEKYGPQNELVLNQKVLQSNIKSLESEVAKYQDYLQNQNKKISNLNSLNTSNTKLLSKIQIKSLSSLQKNQILNFRAENKVIWEKIQKLPFPLPLTPQLKNVEQDPYQRFLNAINFDISDRPVIIYADYPDVSTINTISTPYLKFIIKSKAQILRISAMISPLEGGIPLHFTGNVIFPGELPVNNQVGGGLALIENQEILDGFIYTTVLVSPMYTPISDEELKGARASTQTMATVTDVAGNFSTEWNRIDGVDGLIPKSIRPDFLNNYFDVLKSDYQNLYLARQMFLKIPDYRSQSEKILEEISSLEKVSLKLNSKIVKLSKVGKKG